MTTPTITPGLTAVVDLPNGMRVRAARLLGGSGTVVALDVYEPMTHTAPNDPDGYWSSHSSSMDGMGRVGSRNLPRDYTGRYVAGGDNDDHFAYCKALRDAAHIEQEAALDDAFPGITDAATYRHNDGHPSVLTSEFRAFTGIDLSRDAR